MMLFKNQWTLSQFLLNLRQEATVTFEDLEASYYALVSLNPYSKLHGG